MSSRLFVEGKILIYGWISYAAQAERSEAVNHSRALFLIKTQHPILCRNSTKVVLLVPLVITISLKTFLLCNLRYCVEFLQIGNREAVVKKWVPAENFEELIKNRGITITRFCEDTGIHRSTVHKWFKKGEVPAEAMDQLRSFEFLGVSEFQSLLDQTERGLDWFCDQTGTPSVTIEKWRRSNTVPKWAIVVLKQRLVITRLKDRLDRQPSIDSKAD